MPITPAQRAAGIRLMVLDVDGVLTDGRLYFGAGGETMKVFDVRDGHGIKMLQRAGVETAILSARNSEIVNVRARDLGISRVLQGQADKAHGFAWLLTQTRMAAEHVGFVGDDLPDLPVLRLAGFAATVADARDEVKAAAHFIAPQPGGRAAVRAIAEFVLRAKGVSLETMVGA
jgi:3-deoxy-D-manno-octulosonate 8-phosphate phosphatase (KDO 8-P phosphatase)